MMPARFHRGLTGLAVTLTSLILLTFSSGLRAASDNPRRSLDAFLDKLETFSASFEQTVLDEAGELLERSSGVVSIERPGKFRWEYNKPYQQSIVSDGTTLWLYDVDLAQVTVNTIDSSAAGSAAQLLGRAIEIDAHYDVTVLGTRDGATWLKLTPKVADPQYSAVELGLHDETLGGIRLLDNLGQITELKFSNGQRNSALASTLFTFTPPPDVEIVTGTNTGAGAE